MIIGLTGTLGAGKDVVADYFKAMGFAYFSLSDEVREIGREQGIEITRKNLQDLGNRMRELEGAEYLAKRVLKKMNENSNYVINGIRNPGEVDILKGLNNFYLIAIDALQEERYKRLVARNRESDPKTWQDFLKVDNRDFGIGEKESGQAVAKCMEMADFKMLNNATTEEFYKKIEGIYQKIKQQKNPRPSWDEYFMEISRAVAKRATCDRGKSGCVIVRDKHILVTGYVGSPAGLPHCNEVGHQMKTLRHEDGSETMHCVRTAHAEQNAICQAAKLGVNLNDSTLYCKMTPCSTCAKMIINTGIKRVVCENKYHAGEESEGLFRQAGIQLDILNDKIEHYSNQ